MLIGNVSEDSNGKPVYDGTLAKVYENVGLKIKNIVRSNDADDAAIRRSGEAFLGYKWIPKDDVLKFSTDVSINKRVNGIKSGPDLCLDDIEGEKVVFTPRNLLWLVLQFYDPLGLLSPLTIKLKILLKKTIALKIPWDSPIPSSAQKE